MSMYKLTDALSVHPRKSRRRIFLNSLSKGLPGIVCNST